MHRYTSVLALLAALVGGFAAASAVRAEGGMSSPAAHGMMGGDSNRGGMMGMMKVMPRMGRMMDHCDGMMGGSRPNDQWRKNKRPEENSR